MTDSTPISVDDDIFSQLKDTLENSHNVLQTFGQPA
jgi:hypothetical protein